MPAKRHTPNDGSTYFQGHSQMNHRDQGTCFTYIHELAEEFEKTSDRGAVIAGGAFLDMLLEELLANFFVSGTSKENRALFEGNGPLSTFSSRISLAYRLGLIGQQEYRMLQAVRAIRNQFAHTFSASFVTPPVKDIVRGLLIPIQLAFPTKIFLPREEGDEIPTPTLAQASIDQPRLVFQNAVINLMHRLAPRCMDATSSRRSSPSDYRTAVEALEAVLRHYDDGLRRVRVLQDRLEKLTERFEHAGAEERIDLSKKIKTLSEGLADLGENDKHFMLLYRMLKYSIEQTRLAHERHEAS